MAWLWKRTQENFRFTYIGLISFGSKNYGFSLLVFSCVHSLTNMLKHSFNPKCLLYTTGWLMGCLSLGVYGFIVVLTFLLITYTVVSFSVWSAKLYIILSLLLGDKTKTCIN